MRSQVAVPHLASKQVLERRPVLWILLEQPPDQILDVLVHGYSYRFSLLQLARLLLIGKFDPVFSLLDPPQQLDVVLCPKWGFTYGHLEKHGSDGPEIDLGVVLFVTQNLGSHVQGRSAERLGHGGCRKDPGEPEIGDL